ncbi:hypothetical protein [Burkholderia gladioli]|uniref:hypothetical protein n=1 Tax=Burkholderia gladioli TaxID=28095 RepID=UPI0016411BC4|nr:hypothetical protein [Burkholderia gladioli]
MAATAVCVAWGLHQWADGLRGAALRGDVRVRAAREAIRSALHWRDSVSVLEHALGGIGMALVGFAALQLFYFVESRAGGAVDNYIALLYCGHRILPFHNDLRD